MKNQDWRSSTLLDQIKKSRKAHEKAAKAAKKQEDAEDDAAEGFLAEKFSKAVVQPKEDADKPAVQPLIPEEPPSEPGSLLELGTLWFTMRDWKPFPFQLQAWTAYLEGYSGLVNAPTGSGKTYSLVMPMLLEFIRDHPDPYEAEHTGLRAIWLTPIRALAKEIAGSATRAIEGLGLNWKVGIRSGDTSTAERARQKRKPPEFLVTTPESLHLMLAQKGYPKLFRHLEVVVADEWHELVGSKRGVQVELALSRLRSLRPGLKTWGISATIGNLEEAMEILMGYPAPPVKMIRSEIKKQVEVESIIPEEIEKMPWTGHLGINMIPQILPILKDSQSTLIFTNTRGQAEIWYQKLLEAAPELAGVIAMHHGSISRELRNWVEEALYDGKLKAVVCTSSLDLGVDFRPVETIIQVGGPKGVARFIQRAGRSGHQPGALSKIYFTPTHSLELVEAAALRRAIEMGMLESRLPYLRSFDVLVQYMMTLAVSEGFRPADLYAEIIRTFAYRSVSMEEWEWCLRFIRDGGQSLAAYDDYRKVEMVDGMFKVNNRGVAMRHRMSIGTIVSEVMMRVKFMSGGLIGHIEEWFISQMKPGDVFWFGGRSLELVRVKQMDVLVRRSKKKTGRIPSFLGGRLPWSTEMSQNLRYQLSQAMFSGEKAPELKVLEPLLQLQADRSCVPGEHEFLIEYFESREGHHLLMYPFEGRFVHEGMGTLLAYRLSLLKPISFSIAMNDYGFELLSDQPIPIQEGLDSDLFSVAHLENDIRESINAVEMAKRRFRDIADISGLVFQGFPGQQVRQKHLQSTSELFFNVFHEYEPDNLLLKQAYEEVSEFQLEEARLRAALERIGAQEWVLARPDKPTPFAFPIMVDRLREKLSSEKLKDRVKKMVLQYG